MLSILLATLIATTSAQAASGKGTLRIEKVSDNQVRLTYCDDKGCLAPETVRADKAKLSKLKQKELVLITAKSGGDVLVVAGGVGVGAAAGAVVGTVPGLFIGGSVLDVVEDAYGVELSTSAMIHVVYGTTITAGALYGGAAAAGSVYNVANTALNPMPNVRAYRTLSAIRANSDKPREVKGISRQEMNDLDEQLNSNDLVETQPAASAQ